MEALRIGPPRWYYVALLGTLVLGSLRRVLTQPRLLDWVFLVVMVLLAILAVRSETVLVGRDGLRVRKLGARWRTISWPELADVRASESFPGGGAELVLRGGGKVKLANGRRLLPVLRERMAQQERVAQVAPDDQA